MNISVTRIISMGHRLKDYKGICSSLHGHNVKVTATIKTGGLFIDFKTVDQTLHAILDDFDHAMVLEVDDPLVETLRQFGVRLVVLSMAPTTENIAQWIYNQLSEQYEVECVTVFETDKYSSQVYRNQIIARVE